MNKNEKIGWIKLFRSLREHWIWKDERKLKWWLDILFEVNYEKRKVAIGYKVFDCNKGESLNSILTWAKRWGVSKRVAYLFLKMLEKDKMIELKSVTVTTRLKVCNYEEYQEIGTQMERKGNAKVTQRDTTKEYKEYKEKEKLIKRKKNFKEECLKFQNKYEIEIIEEFYNYWSEQNKSKTKMKFELQQTFEISKRLVTWNKKSQQYNKTNKDNEVLIVNLGKRNE